MLTVASQLTLKAEYTFIHWKERMFTVVLFGVGGSEACFFFFNPSVFLHFLLMGLYHFYKAPLFHKIVLIN